MAVEPTIVDLLHGVTPATNAGNLSLAVKGPASLPIKPIL